MRWSRFPRFQRCSAQILGTVKLSVSQFQTGRRNIELGSRLGERNLVGARINGGKEVTLPHNVPVLGKNIPVSVPPTCARSSTCETAEN